MKKNFLICLLVILVSSFLFTGCTNDEMVELIDGLLEEGNQLYKEERQYKEAVEVFGEVLENDPTNVEAYAGIVSILLDKGYMEKAENVANEASMRVSGEDAAHLFTKVGNKFYEIEKYEEADRLYEKGVEQDRAYYKLNLAKARLEISQEDVDSARRTIDNIGGSDREKPDYILLKAYLTKDDWDDIRYLVDQIDTDEIEEDSLLERVENLKKIDDLDEDEGDLYKVAYLAREYINWGYPYLAIDLLTDYEEEIQEYWEGQYYLGKAYFDHGNLDKALDYLGDAEVLGVDDPGLDLMLARAYFLEGNVDQALGYYEDAISQKDLSDRNDIAEEYIQVLMDTNMMSRAKDTLKDIAEQDDNPWAYVLLCTIAYENENFQELAEYIDALEEYDQIDKEEEKGLVRYKLYYAIEQEDDEVEELLQKYKKLDEHNPEVYFLKGKFAKEQEEDVQDIKDYLYRAIEVDLEGEVTEEARRVLANI